MSSNEIQNVNQSQPSRNTAHVIENQIPAAQTNRLRNYSINQ